MSEQFNLATDIAKRMGARWDSGDHMDNEIIAEFIQDAITIATNDLQKALNEVLRYELERANIYGYSDCTCINHDKEHEIAYESGECPHQMARKIIASLAKAREAQP